jgi:hypothetical protein
MHGMRCSNKLQPGEGGEALTAGTEGGEGREAEDLEAPGRAACLRFGLHGGATLRKGDETRGAPLSPVPRRPPSRSHRRRGSLSSSRRRRYREDEASIQFSFFSPCRFGILSEIFLNPVEQGGNWAGWNPDRD